MKLDLRMIPAAMTFAMLLVAPSHARNYDCSKAGNANKAVCKNAPTGAVPGPTPAPATKAEPVTPTPRHYDCGKVGNASKAACKGTVAAAPTAASAPPPSPSHPSPASAPIATRTPVSRSGAPATTNPAGPNGATAMCGDGTYSHSAHRSGTCSRHGGVKSWY